MEEMHFSFKKCTRKMAVVRQMCWSLLVLAVLQLLISHATGEIRCYCNLPSCVSTGYMCKSFAGICFSEISYTGQPRRNHHRYGHRRRAHHRYRNLMPDHTQSRHGCFESIKSSHKTIKCRLSSYQSNESNSPMQGDSNIACCHSDMCNYVDSLDIKIQISTQSNLSYVEAPGDLDQQIISGRDKKYDDAIRQDLWFKAAVIAVPIAGGFILIFLIFLAVKMLRKDASYQKRAMHSHHHCRNQRSKPKLAFPPGYCDKANNLSTNCKSHLPNGRHMPHPYADVNIPIKTDECLVDVKPTNGFSNSECNAESDNLLLDSVTSWNYINVKNSSSRI